MEKFWEAFLTTGKVTDYLKYKGTMAKEQTRRTKREMHAGYLPDNCEFAKEWENRKESDE